MSKKLIYIFFILIFGCSSKMPVRHLTSDICMIVPENNSKNEVLTKLGKPDIIKNESTSNEMWFYFQVHKSFTKKIPLVGRKFGHEEYDLVSITFNDNQVQKCIYRSLSKEEIFNKYGIKVDMGG